MSQPAKTPEPTMEEILASIRRIIADDDTTKAEPVPAKQSAPSAAAAPSVGPATAAPGPVLGSVAAGASESRESAAAAEREQVEMDAEVSAFNGEMNDTSDESSDVLELTESMRANTSAFDVVEGAPDVEFSEPEPAELPPQRIPRPAASRPDRRLLSSRTAAAVDSAFNSLAHTVLVQNARTLEDLVREMLKPMLKSWLDDNLPSMVERLVRAEIERVSRGRE